MRSIKSFPKVFITTGDEDGVGTEVTWKALHKLRNLKSEFHVWCSPPSAKILRKKIGTKHNVVFVESRDNPARWVERSAELCFQKKFQGIVTAPLSKTLIKSSGLGDVGHTDILKRVSNAKSSHMFFIGKHFSVLLATGHYALENVPSLITTECIESAVEVALHARFLLDPKKRRQPVRVLGLNPHAGEDGMLGTQEAEILQPIINKLKSQGVQGPEVPDASFLKAKKTSIFVALYHDQGLIPFKLAHGFSGVHLTLGLPFPRTSVDHGTAKDIAGKNIADASSMCEAILLMDRLLNTKGSTLWK